MSVGKRSIGTIDRSGQASCKTSNQDMKRTRIRELDPRLFCLPQSLLGSGSGGRDSKAGLGSLPCHLRDPVVGGSRREPDLQNWGAWSRSRDPLRGLQRIGSFQSILFGLCRFGSEWQDDVHDLLAVAWLLDIGELTSAAVGDAGFGNFFRGDRVA